MTAVNRLPVHVSAHLPVTPSDAEDARRIVRHGLAGVLDWLGEDVGPRPGDPIHVVELGGALWVSKQWWADNDPATAMSRLMGQMAERVRRINDEFVAAWGGVAAWEQSVARRYGFGVIADEGAAS